MKKITISEVTKKHFKIISYLVGSWAVALGAVYITKNEMLIGLAPALNYISFVLSKELSNEGYYQALKK